MDTIQLCRTKAREMHYESPVDWTTRLGSRVLCVLLMVVWTVFAAPAASGQTRPPNIVLILIDDMGQRDVGCYGSRFYETPNINALAKRGMRFTEAYAACPVCSPTRASILTGKYPARLNLTDWLPEQGALPSNKLRPPTILSHLPLEESNLARALKARGYVSASIGKWHLGPAPYYPQMQGFDLNVGGTDTGSPPGGYFNFSTPTLKAANPSEYLTDRLTGEAEKFIEVNQKQPFFLYLAHYAVHIPLQARQLLVAHYQQKINPADPQNNPVYAAMVQSVDESVGRIMNKLDALNLTGRTLVIFTADNGGLANKDGSTRPSTSNLPFRDGKGYLYEGGIREPLIVAWPGVIAAGVTCRVPVSSIDFFPTILEASNTRPPTGHISDGTSLMPLLAQTGNLQRNAIYWHYPHYSPQGGKPGAAIRYLDMKLIRFYEDHHSELYNLADDPGETKELSLKEPQVAIQLNKMLDDWLLSVNAKMMTPNPGYRADATPMKLSQFNDFD